MLLTLQSKITGNTCVSKIRVMKEHYVSERDYHCYQCSGENNYCENYHAVKSFEIPLNDVRFKK